MEKWQTNSFRSQHPHISSSPIWIERLPESPKKDRENYRKGAWSNSFARVIHCQTSRSCTVLHSLSARAKIRKNCLRLSEVSTQKKNRITNSNNHLSSDIVNPLLIFNDDTIPGAGSTIQDCDLTEEQSETAHLQNNRNTLRYTR